jgi:hypothetical protein
MKRDWPKHPEDQFDYYQEQKHGIVEIFVTLRLPLNAYELAAGLYRIADFESLDDYVSDCVMNDLDMMCQGEVADDLIISKIKAETSRWMKEQKAHYSAVIKRLKQREAGT